MIIVVDNVSILEREYRDIKVEGGDEEGIIVIKDYDDPPEIIYELKKISEDPVNCSIVFKKIDTMSNKKLDNGLWIVDKHDFNNIKEAVQNLNKINRSR